ncbi:4'-phosphopantetheinyl transferase superfamily protein [Microbacterium sp. SLBN-146]|uniref:4'-phosphopantetheinyl transferase family protein n=1 Tax=Microbacterium sp. SLBN-146 TaxID=2768457 RepID=UPI001152EE08|nr:4'-phosphopantetheinyl transferase superfamily protein [Microbacterium sp. SLBN-146]TQJ31128.1 phosphopantetheinyl transferase [Microbacterium sp. SLBN-146]
MTSVDVLCLPAAEELCADAPLLLTRAQLERAARFHHDSDRRMYVAARVVACRVVAHGLGVPWWRVRAVQCCPDCGGAHGRPSMWVDGHPAPIGVSWSHADDHIAVAWSRDGAALGVDVERRDAVTALDVGAFSPEERAAIEGGVDAAMLWTAKEAAVKAWGTGFAHDPAEYLVSSDRHASRTGGVRHGRRTALWRSVTVSDGVHVVTVATVDDVVPTVTAHFEMTPS